MMRNASIKDPMPTPIWYGTPSYHAPIKAQKPANDGFLGFLDRLNGELFLPEDVRNTRLHYIA